MTTTRDEAELENLLEAAADLAARHIVGVRFWSPAIRSDLAAAHAAAGDPLLLDPAHILEQRALLLAGVDTSGGPAKLPDITHLVNADGELSAVPAGQLTPEQLVIAQVVEAAEAQLLLNQVAVIGFRIAALERLRVLAGELDAIGGDARCQP